MFNVGDCVIAHKFSPSGKEQFLWITWITERDEDIVVTEMCNFRFDLDGAMHNRNKAAWNYHEIIPWDEASDELRRDMKSMLRKARDFEVVVRKLGRRRDNYEIRKMDPEQLKTLVLETMDECDIS